MASISATATTSTFAPPTVPRPAGISASPVLGLPQFRVRNGNVRCSASKNDKTSTGVTHGAAASLLAAASMSAGPALALVDDRMSTEGTGLSLGISDNLLGWILLGVFGLIWSLYIVYTSGLDEDEESGGLSL